MLKWKHSVNLKEQMLSTYCAKKRWAEKPRLLITKPDFKRVFQQICFFESSPGTRSINVSTVKKKLHEAVRVDASAIPENVVTMNSLVTLKILGTGKQLTVKLVFPEFENSREYKISLFSALGAAIFLRKTGDVFTYSTWRKNNTIEILSIPFQPEANGEFFEKTCL